MKHPSTHVQPKVATAAYLLATVVDEVVDLENGTDDFSTLQGTAAAAGSRVEGARQVGGLVSILNSAGLLLQFSAGTDRFWGSRDLEC